MTISIAESGSRGWGVWGGGGGGGGWGVVGGTTRGWVEP